MILKSVLMAGAAVVALASAASAATVINGGSIAAGDNGLGNAILGPNGEANFIYTATTDLRVLDFISVSSVGFNDGTDLAQISFGYVGDPGAYLGTYDTFVISGATTESNSTIGGFDLRAGQSFTLFFEYGAGEFETSNQYSFRTTELAAVPVPAAGLLLLTALGGAAALRRKG